MKVEKYWHDEQENLLIEVFPEQFSIADYYEIVDSTGALIRSKNHLVHVVCDSATPHQWASLCPLCQQ